MARGLIAHYPTHGGRPQRGLPCKGGCGSRADVVLLRATEQRAHVAPRTVAPGALPHDSCAVARRERKAHVSTLVASMDLPPAVHSIPAARHAVRQLLQAWRAPHDLDDAALLVTELVANVVDHVGGEAAFTVELQLSDGWLRISVADGSSVQPRRPRAGQPRSARPGAAPVPGHRRPVGQRGPRRGQADLAGAVAPA